jgi:hypothetical protein
MKLQTLQHRQQNLNLNYIVEAQQPQQLANPFHFQGIYR